MVDWTSPEEIKFERDILVKVIHVLAGIYFWEFLTSLDFEWSFCCGKKKFSWYMDGRLGHGSTVCSTSLPVRAGTVGGDHMGRSRLMNLLFRDGLIYFIIVFLGTLPSAVLVGLNLNPVMDVMVLVPSLYVSLIAACRVVRRLANFSAVDPAVQPSMNTPRVEQSKIMFRAHETSSNPPSDPQIKTSLWSPA
ncbi:hypothetical protein NLI96_g5496 [Meripilus lineatus]|uniref:Uncharacterized protein n=1 Tax=Meripilus lineatus TaxID=2056292 RepID=A0AAD5V878_9APHY|nr:hypothetical protein NLI96_g5496 [Physisporinus lineatus]